MSSRFGRFLEISLATRDIAASVQFYERLGFVQLNTNDTWSHPYGALSDGQIVIGLHHCPLAMPALCFVRPGLAAHVQELRAAGFEPHYTRLGDSDFHELQLRDPLGQAITLLEARTFSPDTRALGERGSALGDCLAYSMPALDPDSAQAFWEHAGWVALGPEERPYAHLALTGDHLTLALHSPRLLDVPALVFQAPDMAARLDQLRARGLAFAPDLPRGLDPAVNALIGTPEGAWLLLLGAED